MAGRAPAPAVALPSTPAAPALAPSTPAPASLAMLATALRMPHGASPEELLAMLARDKAQPDLDAQLIDDDGYPVMAARSDDAVLGRLAAQAMAGSASGDAVARIVADTGADTRQVLELMEFAGAGADGGAGRRRAGPVREQRRPRRPRRGAGAAHGLTTREHP